MTKPLFICGRQVELRRGRAGSFRLLLTGSGLFRVSAPFGASIPEIQNFLDKSAAWAEKKLAQKADGPPSPGGSPSAGGGVFLWGERLALELLLDQPKAGLEKTGDAVKARLPSGIKNPDNLIFNWYKKEAADKLKRLLPVWTEKLSLPQLHCAVRLMKSRWGSCSPGRWRIRLNAWLAARPPECMELVLAHELCHFFERNHGPGFYKLLSLHLPDWKNRARLLENKRSLQ